MIFSSFSTFITVSGRASKGAEDFGAVGPVLVPVSDGASAEKQPKMVNVGLLAQIVSYLKLTIWTRMPNIFLCGWPN
jgi:hypothetical protein